MTQRYQIWYQLTVAVASTIALSLSSCNSTSTTITETDTSEAKEELQVVTTFLPMTQFTKAVAGERAQVIQLIPPNVGPHDYQAKPADAQAIANADMLVKNGLEIELFLDDLIENAGNANLLIIDSSEGIATLASDHGEKEEDKHEHEEHDHDHEEEKEGKEEKHHDHGEFDPHIWLDPKRAIEQVENIKDGLIAADPAGEEDYTANAQAYIEQLQALDTEITQRLAPYAGQTFIAFHDFVFYFADSYNLNAEFLVDVPEESPSPEDVRRLIETAQQENVKALLTEPQVGEKAFASLANDLQVKVTLFDPMETGDASATQPESYFTIMRQNLDSLEEAFGESPQSWWIPQLFQLTFSETGV